MGSQDIYIYIYKADSSYQGLIAEVEGGGFLVILIGIVGTSREYSLVVRVECDDTWHFSGLTTVFHTRDRQHITTKLVIFLRVDIVLT